MLTCPCNLQVNLGYGGVYTIFLFCFKTNIKKVIVKYFSILHRRVYIMWITCFFRHLLFFLSLVVKSIIAERRDVGTGTHPGDLGPQVVSLHSREWGMGHNLAVVIEILEPRCEKTCLRGFRPDPTQTGKMARDFKF